MVFQCPKNFNGFVNEMEQAIGGTIYRPTAKKSFNNWYLWALEQRKRISQTMKKRESRKEETR